MNVSLWAHRFQRHTVEMCSQKAVRYVATREPMSDQMTRTSTTIAISVRKAESNPRDSQQPTRLSAAAERNMMNDIE